VPIECGFACSVECIELFILDEYQIAEARVHGADTILLIVAMLAPPRLCALYAYSVSLGMESLVEVNNAEEMRTALELGAKVIGVNNRNLHGFNVDTGTTSRLADMVGGKDVILCAPSGVSSREDVQLYTEQGVGAQDPRAFIVALDASVVDYLFQLRVDHLLGSSCDHGSLSSQCVLPWLRHQRLGFGRDLEHVNQLHPR
jgi:hypothetical protein